MRIEPELPNMSEVDIISLTYSWKNGGSTNTMVKTVPPYIADIDLGSYQMTSPVRLTYTMSNGEHVMFVNPNETAATDFESGDSNPGTMVSYPKVKMIDMGVAVRVRARNSDYVPEAGSIPLITIVDSHNEVKMEGPNNVYMKDMNDTELYLVNVSNEYYYPNSKYNTEPAVYPLVRAIQDTTRNIIVDVTKSLSAGDSVCRYKYHKFLTDVIDIRASVNDTVVAISYVIDDGDISITLPSGLTSDDEVVIMFNVDMYYNGTQEIRQVFKTVYVGV